MSTWYMKEVQKQAKYTHGIRSHTGYFYGNNEWG